MLEFPSMFLGGTPNNTPALYSLMNYADIVGGTWYPDGGMVEVSNGFGKLSKELGVMSKTLQLSKTLKSNKSLSYRILAQIAMSVPNRVKFNSIQYDGKRSVIIMGAAATDQDILKLINNLNNQKLVGQASLASMTLPKSKSGTQGKKGFKIFVKVKG